jgi:hypothetical protein
VNSIRHKSAESVKAAAEQQESGQTCNATLFVEPLAWMQPLISRQPQGKLYCPKCKAKVGAYSWVSGVFTMANEFSLCFCANASLVRSSVHRMSVLMRRQAGACFLFSPVKARLVHPSAKFTNYSLKQLQILFKADFFHWSSAHYLSRKMCI